MSQSAEVKFIQIGVYSFDEYDFEAHRDECLAVDLSVGPVGSDGGNDFQAFFVTGRYESNEGWLPGWQNQPRLPESIAIITEEISRASIETALNDILTECLAAGWPGCIDLLRTKMNWEYENYSVSGT